MAFYIEAGSGKSYDQSNLSGLDPTKTYYESGSGTSYTGSQLTSKYAAPTTTTNYSSPTTYQAPTTAPQPVGVLSSQTGQQVNTQNTQNLQQAEANLYAGAAGYTGPSIVDFLNKSGQKSDPQSRANLAVQYGVAPDANTYLSSLRAGTNAGMNTQLLSILRGLSASPAQQTMVQGINQVASQGNMTPQQQLGLQGLQTTEDNGLAALASARSALDAQKYTGLDAYMKMFQDQKTQYDQQLSDYYKSVAPLRQQQLSLLSPGAREQEISKQLSSLRAEMDKSALDLQKRQFAEFEGQTQGFASGRANALERNESFAKQERLLKERNLLTELGLEQDLRKAKLGATESQLGFLADDYNLRQKVNDRISQMEENVLARADTLQQRQHDDLFKFLDAFEGIDPSKMPSQVVSQIQQLAQATGVPIDLINEALKAQYNRYVYEQSTKKSGDSTTLQGLLIDASKGGAPSSLIQQAKATGDPVAAAQLLSKYLKGSTESTATTGPAKAEQRDSIVSNYLQSKKGTDGYVSAETYQEALRKFIANDGTQANFFASFPQQTFLRQQEIDKLPAALRPVQTPTNRNLSTEQNSIINDAKSALDAWKQANPYQDFSTIRQAIIQQSIQNYGFDPSPYF